MSLTTDKPQPPPPPGMLRAWFALHRCPACGSTNVRRSTIRSRETGAHPWRSPYRCRACSERFWVLSRKARTLTVAGVVAGFVAVLVGAVVMLTPPDDSATNRIAPASEEVEILTASPPGDGAPLAASAVQVSPKATPAATSSAATLAEQLLAAKADAAEVSAPARAGFEKPLRSPAQPFVK